MCNGYGCRKWRVRINSNEKQNRFKHATMEINRTKGKKAKNEAVYGYYVRNNGHCNYSCAKQVKLRMHLELIHTERNECIYYSKYANMLCRLKMLVLQLAIDEPADRSKKKKSTRTFLTGDEKSCRKREKKLEEFTLYCSTFYYLFIACSNLTF